ncbi:DUF3667 domain-containing protein [Mesoterricola silvestris]|uniref:DUF3667 domain-containing protein n=1 Tax=Mesoterricola silvestris TaxID=2927979 RepID=A0AA48GPU9_9BACT|nr:DUF3667 domain-containing protein [Mesoterricola silvestris]BDU71970.1 hypothetical protein METEAL_11440 [Mesoterricola silvestris]
MTSTGSCLDCGTPLHGPFCSQCGQHRQDRDLRLGHVLKEAVLEFFNLDSRLVATLRLLFLRPGELTLAYFAGHRARFLPPFRLYVFVSILLFMLLGSAGTSTRAPGKGRANVIVQVDDEAPLPEAAPAKKPGRIKRGILKAKENPEAFKAVLLLWISRVMFLLLPAFAALLLLFHAGSGTYFVEHVIFSLHFHAYAFSVFIVQEILAKAPWGLVRVAGGLLFLALPVHLCLALKRVHGGKAWKRHLRGIALSGTYLVVVGTVLVTVVLLVITRG